WEGNPGDGGLVEVQAWARLLLAPPFHLSGTERAARALHHRRRLQPELVPLLAEGIELHPLVVLQAGQERLEPLVRLHLARPALQHLDGLLALAALVLAPR